ncbi:MAG: VWA domain-containing protein [Eggerthellaceae bacterium]|nr:VWA domain-containing protein [Eggerthellaceae bacterium]
MATDSYWEGGLDGGDEPWWPQDFNTEEYNALKEGGFISAKVRPLSSLSADVDTASYCNVRRMIRDGYFAEDIPAGAIRIEEMLNYFSYDYAQPAGQDLFGTTVQVGDCPWNKDTKLLLMGFSSAPEMRNESAGSNLVFLIDVSGSMDSRDKLDLLQDAFAVLVDQLGDKDRISIVTYASGEDVVLEGASGADKKKIMRAIKRLHADGSTNGEAGLKMAYEIAQDNFIEGGVNRIILASDGDLNVGMTDESSLEDYVSKQRDTGVYLSVLGFGSGNYKDNKMETLADNGNGQYHYIDCVEEAERVFGEKLTANLVPLADDVKLQVEFNPNMVKAYRLIGYENRALADEDFRDDTKDAGEIGPGHQFTVAYEVALVGSAQEVAQIDLKYSGQEQAVEGADERDIVADGEWLTCTMRYRPAGESNAREQSFVVDGSEWTDAPSDDWRFAAAVAWAGMILRDSDYSKDTTLDDVLAFIPKSSGDPYRTEFTELLEELV